MLFYNNASLFYFLLETDTNSNCASVKFKMYFPFGSILSGIISNIMVKESSSCGTCHTQLSKKGKYIFLKKNCLTEDLASSS